MARKKRRRRKNELAVPAVPLRMYRDEEACRMWIAWLEGRLQKAKKVLENCNIE